VPVSLKQFHIDQSAWVVSSRSLGVCHRLWRCPERQHFEVAEAGDRGNMVDMLYLSASFVSTTSVMLVQRRRYVRHVGMVVERR
jgi:hypothetical protein